MCVAIVGLGGIAGKAYLPVLADRQDLELLPCSRTASTVELVQARYRLPRGTTRTMGMCVLQKHRSGAAHPTLFGNYIDDTIHLIDLLRFFGGEGEAVTTVQRLQDGRLVGAVSLVALEKGGHAVVATSLEAAGWSETCNLHGEGATLDLEAFSTLRFAADAEERVWREDYASGWKPTLEARGFPQQIAHFFECLASRAPPVTSAWEALRTQRLLEEMVARAHG